MTLRSDAQTCSDWQCAPSQLNSKRFQTNDAMRSQHLKLDTFAGVKISEFRPHGNHRFKGL
eukprot:154703-Amphidinium_carterae.1